MCRSDCGIFVFLFSSFPIWFQLWVLFDSCVSQLTIVRFISMSNIFICDLWTLCRWQKIEKKKNTQTSIVIRAVNRELDLLRMPLDSRYARSKKKNKIKFLMNQESNFVSLCAHVCACVCVCETRLRSLERNHCLHLKNYITISLWIKNDLWLTILFWPIQSKSFGIIPSKTQNGLLLWTLWICK